MTSDDDTSHRRRFRVAFLLFASAVLVVGGAVGLAATGRGSAPMVLGAVPAGALLAYFGYRAHAASKRGDHSIDERDASPHDQAAALSFYVLAVFVMAEAAIDVVPDDELRGVLVLVAGASIVTSTLYYKYVPSGEPSTQRETA